MSVFSISPPVSVNKGLAEPWVSPLPMQIDLMKTTAAFAMQGARLKQQRETANRKSTMDWWDKFKPDLTGLLVDQQADVIKEVDAYLDYSAMDINLDRMPANKAESMKKKQGIYNLIDYYNANKHEMAAFKEFTLTDNGDYMDELKVAPLIYNNVFMDEDGNMRTDIRSGEVMKYALNDPEVVRTYDSGRLYEKFSDDYKAEKKDYLDTQPVESIDEDEDRMVTLQRSFEASSLWDWDAAMRNEFVLRPDVEASVRRISPPFHKQLLLLTEDKPESTYGSILREFAEVDATGQHTIGQMHEQSQRKTPSPYVVDRESKKTLLTNVFNALMTGDRQDLVSRMKTMEDHIGGVKYKYIKNEELNIYGRYFTNEKGDRVQKTITVTGYVPVFTKPMQQQIDLLTAMAGSWNFELAMETAGKELFEGSIYLTGMVFDIPDKSKSVVFRDRLARDITIDMARLASVLDKKEFSSELINEWRNEVTGQQDVFQGTEGNFDWK